MDARQLATDFDITDGSPETSPFVKTVRARTRLLLTLLLLGGARGARDCLSRSLT